MEDVAETSRSVAFSLSEEGLGQLERAGLAGLHMSLVGAEVWADQGEAQAIELTKSVSWELGPSEVKLSWTGKDEDALSEIVEWAWQIRDGLYFLPAVHRTQDELDHPWMRTETHNGLLQTFFQHNLVMPRASEDTAQIVPLDEGETIRVSYRELRKEKDGQLKTTAPCQYRLMPKIVSDDIHRATLTRELASWLYPGAAKRFGPSGENNWRGDPRSAFLLLFAPLACMYLRLPNSQIRDRSYQNWAVVVPLVMDLDKFSAGFIRAHGRMRERFLRTRVASLGDAALRFSLGYAGTKLKRVLEIPMIRAVAMGSVGHYRSQKIRKAVLDVRPRETVVAQYAALLRHLRNTAVPIHSSSEDSEETPTHRIRVPTCRERIADNLINGLAWYAQLGEPPPWQKDRLEQYRKSRSDSISVERLWFRDLQRERRNLVALAQEEEIWDDPEDQARLRVFREALRGLLNKEEKALTRGGARGLHDRWEDKVDEIRRRLMHSRTRAQVRATVTELLAEAGGSAALTHHQAQIWNMLNHPHDWQKARDLALLALVIFTDKRLGRAAEPTPNQEGAESDE